MADTAVVGILRALLIADTGEFEKRLGEATGDVKKLAQALQKDLEPRQRAINGLVKEFLGGPEIRRAEEYAKAVEKIGGVSKLTAADQAKVNRTVAEALDHYRALGIEAPAHLQKIYDETRKTEQGTSLLGSSFGRLTAAFTAAGLIDRGVTALVGLGKGAFEAAGHIVDLSHKTGLSIEGVQRFGFVAEQTGATIDHFADATFKLGVNMEQGGAKVTRGLRDLGLEYQTLKTLKPEEQFDAVMRALASIEDPQERNRIGVDLMGKSYANVAGSVNEYIALMKQAPVTSAKAVEATDAAGDAILAVWQGAKAAATEAIGGIIIQIDALLDKSRQADEARRKLGQAVPVGATAVGGVGTGLSFGPGPEPTTPKASNFGQDVALVTDRSTAALVSNVAQLKAARAEIAALTSAQREEIDAGLALGQTIEDIGTKFHLSEDAQRLYAASTREGAKATKDASKAQDEFNKQVEKFTGRDLVQQVDDLVRAYLAAEAQGGLTAAAQKELAKQLFELEKKGAPLPPIFNALVNAEAQLDFQSKTNAKSLKAIVSVLDNTTDAIKGDTVAMKTNAVATKDLIGKLPNYIGLLKGAGNAALEAGRKEDERNKKLKESLRGIVQGFEAIATISGKSMGEVVRALGTGVAAAETFRDSFKAATAKDAGFFQITSGVLGMFGSALTIGKLIHDAFTTPEYKSLMRDVGDRWGVSISEGLAQQLAADEAGILSAAVDQIAGDFGARLKGSKHLKELGLTAGRVAELLNLDKIISESGGLNDGNLEKWIRGANDLFLLIEDGGENGARATKTLSTLIGQFAAQAKSTGTLWSQSFKEMVAHARNLGVAVEGVSAAIEGELQSTASATEKIVRGFVDSLPKLSGLEENEARSSARKVVAIRQEEFDRISRLTLAAFNAYIAEGHTAVEATQALGPAIQGLVQSAKDFGFAGGAAFDSLSRWQGLVEQNGPLLDQVGGLNQLMVALANLGQINADTFGDLEQQGLDAYQHLIDAGFTEQEALAQMAPLLNTINDLRAKGQIEVDDQTQALLDNAEAAGLLEDQVSVQDTLTKGFEGMTDAVDHLGDRLEDIFANQVPRAIGETSRALLDMMSLASSSSGITGGSYRPAVQPTVLSRGFIAPPTYAMTRPAFAASSATGPVILPTRDGVTVVLEQDGRRAAEWIVPNIPGVLKRLRLA